MGYTNIPTMSSNWFGLGDNACFGKTCRFGDFCSQDLLYRSCRHCSDIIAWCDVNRTHLALNYPSCFHICAEKDKAVLQEKLNSTEAALFNLEQEATSRPALDILHIWLLTVVGILLLLLVFVACYWFCGKRQRPKQLLKLFHDYPGDRCHTALKQPEESGLLPSDPERNVAPNQSRSLSDEPSSTLCQNSLPPPQYSETDPSGQPSQPASEGVPESSALRPLLQSPSSGVSDSLTLNTLLQSPCNGVTDPAVFNREPSPYDGGSGLTAPNSLQPPPYNGHNQSISNRVDDTQDATPSHMRLPEESAPVNPDHPEITTASTTTTTTFSPNTACPDDLQATLTPGGQGRPLTPDVGVPVTSSIRMRPSHPENAGYLPVIYREGHFGVQPMNAINDGDKCPKMAMGASTYDFASNYTPN